MTISQIIIYIGLVAFGILGIGLTALIVSLIIMCIKGVKY